MQQFLRLHIFLLIVFRGEGLASDLTLRPEHSVDLPSRSDPELEPDDNHDGDTSFRMLISGGYLPQRYTLTKYVVSIRTSVPSEYFGDNHFCTGTIVASTLILTAAHCVMDLNKIVTRPYHLKVVGGAPNRLQRDKSAMEFDVAAVITHHGYRPKMGDDIAILRLARPIPHDNDLMKIIAMDRNTPPVNTSCTVLGWGRLFKLGPYASNAVYVDLFIKSRKFCQEFFSDFEADNICAYDNDYPEKALCRGDSGAPLICSHMLVGIASWGMQCNVGFPAIFTSVAYHGNWIRSINLGHNTQKTPNHNVLIFILAGCILYIFIMYK